MCYHDAVQTTDPSFWEQGYLHFHDRLGRRRSLRELAGDMVGHITQDVGLGGLP